MSMDDTKTSRDEVDGGLRVSESCVGLYTKVYTICLKSSLTQVFGQHRVSYIPF